MDPWGLPASEALSIQCPFSQALRDSAFLSSWACAVPTQYSSGLKFRPQGGNLKPVLSGIFFEPVSQDMCFYLLSIIMPH